jgi:hypothetical protein
MSEHTPYVHANINYQVDKVRLAIRDCQYGRLSREQLAEILRMRAIEIEKRVLPDQPNLWDGMDVNDRVKAHLQANRMLA